MRTTRVTDVLKTGDQIAAARVLAGLSQGDLAERAKVHRNTITAMEKRGSQLLVSGFDLVQKITQVFQDAGVLFIDDAEDHGVGVMRAKPASPGAAQPRRPFPTRARKRAKLVPAPKKKAAPRRA